MSNLTSYLKDLIFTLSCESGYYVNVYDIDYENSRARICVKDTSTGYDRYCTVEKSQLGVYVIRDNDPCKPYMHEKEFLERYAKLIGLESIVPLCTNIDIAHPASGRKSTYLTFYNQETEVLENHVILLDPANDYKMFRAFIYSSKDPGYTTHKDFKNGTEDRSPI